MTLLVAVTAFVLMEPATYVLHRWVMHGRRGMAWHRSHHLPPAGALEANDAYPVVFAGLGLAGSAAGASIGSLSLLLPVSLGAAAYGIAYLAVHDLYIHRRFGLVRGTYGVLERLREAHRIHHLFGGEPYGMLLPVVPASLRRRAALVSADPLPDAPVDGRRHRRRAAA